MNFGISSFWNFGPI